MNRRSFFFGLLGAAAVPLPVLAAPPWKTLTRAEINRLWRKFERDLSAAFKDMPIEVVEPYDAIESAVITTASGRRVAVYGSPRGLDRELRALAVAIQKPGVTRRAAVVDRPASRASIERAMERAKVEAIAEIRKGPPR